MKLREVCFDIKYARSDAFTRRTLNSSGIYSTILMNVFRRMWNDKHRNYIFLFTIIGPPFFQNRVTKKQAKDFFDRFKYHSILLTYLIHQQCFKKKYESRLSFFFFSSALVLARWNQSHLLRCLHCFWPGTNASGGSPRVGAFE